MARNKRRVPKTQQTKHVQPQRRTYDPGAHPLPSNPLKHGGTFVQSSGTFRERQSRTIEAARISLGLPLDTRLSGMHIDAQLDDLTAAAEALGLKPHIVQGGSGSIVAEYRAPDAVE